MSDELTAEQLEEAVKVYSPSQDEESRPVVAGVTTSKHEPGVIVDAVSS